MYFSSHRRRNSWGKHFDSLQQGFTLIELMVVLVIVGVLAALIVPNVMGHADEARVTAARADVNRLSQALDVYRLENQGYPESHQGLEMLAREATTRTGITKRYVNKLPNDPWGHPYQYANPGQYGEVDVFSFGADGRQGGVGINADIGNW